MLCHGKDSEVREGHKSFPSGHTSCKQIPCCLHSVVKHIDVVSSDIRESLFHDHLIAS